MKACGRRHEEVTPADRRRRSMRYKAKPLIKLGKKSAFSIRYLVLVALPHALALFSASGLKMGRRVMSTAEGPMQQLRLVSTGLAGIEGLGVR